MAEKYRIENEGPPNGSKAWKHVVADLARYSGYLTAIAMVLGWFFTLQDLPARIESERIDRQNMEAVISQRIDRLEEAREVQIEVNAYRKTIVEEHDKRLDACCGRGRR